MKIYSIIYYMQINLVRTLLKIDCAKFNILFLILVHILNVKFRTDVNIDDVPFRKLFHVLRTPFHKDVALLVTPFLMLFQMLNKKFLTFVNIDLVTLNMLVNIFFVVLNIAPSVLLNIPLMTFHMPLIAPLNSPPNTLTTFNILPINHNCTAAKMSFKAPPVACLTPCHMPFQFPVNKLLNIFITPIITSKAPLMMFLILFHVSTISNLIAGHNNFMIFHIKFIIGLIMLPQMNLKTV